MAFCYLFLIFAINREKNMEGKFYQVTIGMPVYGVEKYIRKSLESALNQTFSGNIEIIMVDDCGPDRSVDIIRELQQSHPRGKDIRIITQPQNMGCWAARNTILKEAKGKYLFLMDSDDYISPECIEVLYAAAEKYQVEAAYGSIQNVDDKDNKLDTYQYDFRLFEHEDELASYANLKYKITITNFIWNILIRTDFLRRNDLHFPKTKFWDDVLFNANFQPLVQKAVLLPNLTYYYVIRDNSLSSYENRNRIKIEEIRHHLHNSDYLKRQCLVIKDKPYYEMRCAKEMLQTLYTVIGAIKNRSIIVPRISNRELRNAMKHPISLSEIVHFKKHRKENILFYLIGELPPFLSIFMIKIVAKRKGLL